MEAGQKGVLSSDKTLRPMQCGRLRFKTELPASNLCQLAFQPICSGNRCFPDSMERPPGIYLPNSCTNHNWQVPPEDLPGRLHSGTDSSGLAHPKIVLLALRVADGLSSTPANL